MKRAPTSSRLPALRGASLMERRAHLASALGLAPEDFAAFDGVLPPAVADVMVENAIGACAVPLGVALNFIVNGRDVLVPMAIEEPSVIAAASYAAKLVRAGGGFRARSTPPIMIAQVELRGLSDVAEAAARLRERATEIVAWGNESVPRLVGRGGGVREVVPRVLRPSPDGVLAVHLHVDCRDAMGANLCNTIAEAVSPRLAELTGGRLGLRILSNLCDERMTEVVARVPLRELAADLEEANAVAQGVVEASTFAELDPYRAATHNKGIFNGLDAVALATGQDWRAAEAGAHAYAARSGRYAPLSTWAVDADQQALDGKLLLPLAFGTVGGALRVHPGPRAALLLAGEPDATELAQLAASAGLATNLAALRALATEGIQRGHMALHGRYRDPG